MSRNYSWVAKQNAFHFLKRLCGNFGHVLHWQAEVKEYSYSCFCSWSNWERCYSPPNVLTRRSLSYSPVNGGKFLCAHLKSEFKIWSSQHHNKPIMIHCAAQVFYLLDIFIYSRFFNKEQLEGVTWQTVFLQQMGTGSCMFQRVFPLLKHFYCRICSWQNGNEISNVLAFQEKVKNKSEVITFSWISFFPVSFIHLNETLLVLSLYKGPYWGQKL